MNTDPNATGDGQEALMGYARELATKHPGHTVNVCVVASIYHTPPNQAPQIIWSATVGHREAVTAPSLPELRDKVSKQGAPETMRAKAAEMRRQAEALEAAAAER